MLPPQLLLGHLLIRANTSHRKRKAVSQWSKSPGYGYEVDCGRRWAIRKRCRAYPTHTQARQRSQERDPHRQDITHSAERTTRRVNSQSPRCLPCTNVIVPCHWCPNWSSPSFSEHSRRISCIKSINLSRRPQARVHFWSPCQQSTTNARSEHPTYIRARAIQDGNSQQW